MDAATPAVLARRSGRRPRRSEKSVATRTKHILTTPAATEDGFVGRHAGLAEHEWAIEHEGVDAGRLLEEVHADHADEDPAHARRRPDEQLLPNVAASVAVTNLWLPDGLLDLLEAQVGLGRVSEVRTSTARASAWRPRIASHRGDSGMASTPTASSTGGSTPTAYMIRQPRCTGKPAKA
jgi:hypothetical protein